MLSSLTINAPLFETDVYKWGCDDDYCKEQEILAAGVGADNVVDVGTVLGRVVRGTVTVGVVSFAGTGDGVLTKANPAYGADVQAGTYKARLIEAGANAGQFEVVRPDGTVDGFAAVGGAYDGQVKFTIADGAADFAAGAEFSLPVTIAEGSKKVVPLNLAAADGSQNACGVSLMKRVAADGGVDQTILAAVRGPAILREQGLKWPAGITDDQKAARVAQLVALGFVVRPS